MTQLPSMDHLNYYPNPAQCMQFGNTMVTPIENPDTAIFFDNASDTPTFFDLPLQDFNNNQSVEALKDKGAASHQPSQVNTVPQVSPWMQEQVLEEGPTRCQEPWQNQCHNETSMDAIRCTTWYHRQSATMTTTICMTAILTSRTACSTLLHF
jgi:hypothetical protein